MAREENAPDSGRQERVAALRREHGRRERRRTWLIGAGVAVVVLGVAGAFTFVVASSRPDKAPVEDTVAAAKAGLMRFPDLPRNHVAGTVDYPQNPPAGGDHDPAWLNCGIYDAPVRNENAVHAMEHGAAWLTYRPDLPAAQVEALRKAVRSQSYVLLSPYPGLPSPIVASAWGIQTQIDSADSPQVIAFPAAYAQARDAPEPGAPCTGGIGKPTG